MKEIFAVFGLLALLSACSQNKKTNHADHQTDAALNEKIRLQHCYLAVVGRDSAFLDITQNTGNIAGKLTYKPLEKDKRDGTFTGSFSEDTLKVNYTFNAEGSKSAQEIYFKLSDDKLIEGVGEYEEKNSKFVYKNPTAIDFSGKSFVFKPSEFVK